MGSKHCREEDLDQHVLDEFHSVSATFTEREEQILASDYVEVWGSEHHNGTWFLGLVKAIILSTPARFDIQCYRCGGTVMHQVYIHHIGFVAEKKKAESQVQR